MKPFRKAVETLINVYSNENGSDTPDFILAQYMIDCLKAYDRALKTREKWYGRTVGDGKVIEVPASLFFDQLATCSALSEEKVTYHVQS